jgi:hypothetical protein
VQSSDLVCKPIRVPVETLLRPPPVIRRMDYRQPTGRQFRAAEYSAHAEFVTGALAQDNGVFCHNAKRPRPGSLGAPGKSPFGEK